MRVTSVKTHKVTVQDTDLTQLLDRYLPKLQEGSVVAITSKVAAICEGRVVAKDQATKEELVAKEAELYIPAAESKYEFMLTIKNNLLIPTAGIDESNGNGLYILWPSDPQKTANMVRVHLARRYGLKNIGVVVTDSKTTPLRWGVTGIAIAHSGFAALNDYRGTPDIFGRDLKVTQVHVMDALAAAAVLCMGEGKEQTPFAVIEDVPFVAFQERNPTQRELADLHISIEEDLYASLLKGAHWHEGGKL